MKYKMLRVWLYSALYLALTKEITSSPARTPNIPYWVRENTPEAQTSKLDFMADFTASPKANAPKNSDIQRNDDESIYSSSDETDQQIKYKINQDPDKNVKNLLTNNTMATTSILRKNRKFKTTSTTSPSNFLAEYKNNASKDLLEKNRIFNSDYVQRYQREKSRKMNGNFEKPSSEEGLLTNDKSNKIRLWQMNKNISSPEMEKKNYGNKRAKYINKTAGASMVLEKNNKFHQDKDMPQQILNSTNNKFNEGGSKKSRFIGKKKHRNVTTSRTTESLGNVNNVIIQKPFNNITPENQDFKEQLLSKTDTSSPAVLSDLLNKIGLEHPSAINSFSYSEKESTKICWYERIFAQFDSNHELNHTWVEYEVVFETPSERNGENNARDFEEQGYLYLIDVVDPYTNITQELPFKIYWNNLNTSIWVNETKRCGTANHLDKTYKEELDGSSKYLSVRLTNMIREDLIPKNGLKDIFNTDLKNKHEKSNIVGASNENENKEMKTNKNELDQGSLTEPKIKHIMSNKRNKLNKDTTRDKTQSKQKFSKNKNKPVLTTTPTADYLDPISIESSTTESDYMEQSTYLNDGLEEHDQTEFSSEDSSVYSTEINNKPFTPKKPSKNERSTNSKKPQAAHEADIVEPSSAIDYYEDINEESSTQTIDKKNKDYKTERKRENDQTIKNNIELSKLNFNKLKQNPEGNTEDYYTSEDYWEKDVIGETPPAQTSLPPKQSPLQFECPPSLASILFNSKFLPHICNIQLNNDDSVNIRGKFVATKKVVEEIDGIGVEVDKPLFEVSEDTKIRMFDGQTY